MTLADSLRGKRFGVAMSSTFFGFYAHTGFARALLDAGLRPALWSGASAGALTAAFAVAGRLDPFTDLLADLKRADFWDPTLPFGRPPGLLRGARFGALLERWLPARFEDCPDPLLTVSTNLSRRDRHVDTTGPLAPAVLASCALPILFKPVVRGGELHADGGLLDKVPVRACLEHADLDALVVHLIPSSGLSKPLASHPLGFLDQALDWVRHDGWQHQADLARAHGIEVHVMHSDPERLSPFKMSRGPAVLASVRGETTRWLRAPVSTG